MNGRVFKLKVLENAMSFLNELPPNVRKKVEHNILRVQMGEKDNELFKKLENSDIWEFRTLYDKKAYRLFSFWDTEEDTLVVATHGIVKKTQKTPPKEIRRAQEIKKRYFENKNR